VTIPRRERGGISLRRNLSHTVSQIQKPKLNFLQTFSKLATRFVMVAASECAIELEPQVPVCCLATADK
jgi:hypothetical protein